MGKKTVEKKKNTEIDSFNNKDAMKELNEYFDKKKDEIIHSAINTIDEQIEFRVNKRMKEEEKRFVRGKNGKIIRRDIIIVLLLAILCYFTYCLYQVDYFQIRKTVVESSKTGNEEDVKPISDNDEKDEFDSAYYILHYRYLVDNLQINDEDVFLLYQNDMTKDDISNDLKLKIAYKNLSDEEKTDVNNTITFQASSLLEIAKNIFGNDSFLTYNMFTYNNTRFMFYLDTYLGFKEEEDKIQFVYEFESAMAEDNKLIFNVVVAKISSNNELLSLNDKVVVKKYQNESILTYQNKLSTTQFTFVKEDDHYIFESIKNN